MTSHHSQSDTTRFADPVWAELLDGAGGPSRRPYTPPGECREVRVESDGVTLTKTLDADDGPATVTYALRSSWEVPVRFRVLDLFIPPDGDAVADLIAARRDPARTVDVTWWVPPSEEVALHRRLPEGRADGAKASIAFVPRLVVEYPADAPLPRAVEAERMDAERMSLGSAGSDSTGHPRRRGSVGNGGGGAIGNGASGVESDAVATGEDGTGHGVAGDLRPASAAATSVVAAIPAHDEEETVGEVVAAAKRRADAVLVVDDGSADDTAERARRAGAFVVEHGRNRGYGAALKTVFREATAVGADRVVTLDSDGQHDPSDIPRLVDRLDAGDAGLVIGNRFGRDSGSDTPVYRRLGLVAINAATNLSLGRVRAGDRIGDTQSGFRAYDARAIGSLAAASGVDDGMDASIDILYHLNREDVPIAEVETAISYDVAEANGSHPVVHGVVLLRKTLQIAARERPQAAVGGSALLLAVGVALVGGAAQWSALTVGSPSSVVAVLATLLGVTALVGAGALTVEVANGERG